MFYLSQLLQIIEDFSSPYVYSCSDFNANVLSHSRFGDELRRLCSDNLLCLSDTLLLPSDTFTFISSSHDTVSWLDYVLSTTSGHSWKDIRKHSKSKSALSNCIDGVT